nr:hypothetical protein [uncultured Roseococcus sp.]
MSRSNNFRSRLLFAVSVVALPSLAEAHLGGGGGFHGGGFRGGGGFQGGSLHRPEGGGGFQRPAGGNFQRPGGGGQGIQRPAGGQVHRPGGGGQGGQRPEARNANMVQRNEIHGGNQVTINNANVRNSGNVRPAQGGRPPPPPPPGGWARPVPVAVPYPAYVGSSGWDVGAAIVGGIAVGATAGLVAGAIATPALPPPQTTVIYETPPPAGSPSTATDAASAQSAADAANRAAARSEAAARQARQSASTGGSGPPAAPTTPAPAPPPASAVGPVPPGARFALGSHLAEPPPDCASEQIGPIQFDHCGADWLQPVMIGGNVLWVAVPSPRG